MSSSWETPVQLFPQSYANGKCLWWFPCHLRQFVFAKPRIPKRLESYPKAAWERPAMFSPAQSGDLWGAEAAEGLFSTLQVSMVRCWRYIIASAEGKRWSPAASVVEPVPQFHQDLAIKKTKWPRDPFRQPRVLLKQLVLSRLRSFAWFLSFHRPEILPAARDGKTRNRAVHDFGVELWWHIVTWWLCIM